MTTAKQVEANRRNARKSTGPRTADGKARSRMNAVTHGLSAQTLILPNEDPREFQGRLEAWRDSLQPCTAYEEGLVRQAVGHSWRLDRADRVQAALINQSIAGESGEDDRQAQEVLSGLTRRLLPLPEATVARPAGPTGPDDPDDPALLLPGIERTAAGCRWLIDRWADLRTVIDGGKRWDDDQMTCAVRLLGKRPLDAADDHQVLSIVVACFAADRTRPDPFAALWDGLSVREIQRYRERLLGRRLRDAMPASPEDARAFLVEVVNETVERLREIEAALRARDADRNKLRPVSLLFDDSPEGRWVRTRQLQYDHAIARIVGRFTTARRRGAPMLADPPPRRRTPKPGPVSRPLDATSPTAPQPGPVPSRRDEIAAARRQRGRRWRSHTVPPHRPPGGRQPSFEFHHPGQPRPGSRRRRQTPEQIRRTAQRFVKLFRWLGLLLLVAALSIAARSQSAAPATTHPAGEHRDTKSTKSPSDRIGRPVSPIAINLRSSCPSCSSWLILPSPEPGVADRPAIRSPDSGRLPAPRRARAGLTPADRQNEPISRGEFRPFPAAPTVVPASSGRPRIPPDPRASWPSPDRRLAGASQHGEAEAPRAPAPPLETAGAIDDNTMLSCGARSAGSARTNGPSPPPGPEAPRLASAASTLLPSPLLREPISMTPTSTQSTDPCPTGPAASRRTATAALALIAASVLAAIGLVRAGEPGADPSKRPVDFNREVRPILAKNCFACHGQDEAKRAKELRLDVRASAVKPLKDGDAAIVPGDPEASELIARIADGRRDAAHAPAEDRAPPRAGRGRYA